MKAISICIGRRGSKGLPGKNKRIVKGEATLFLSNGCGMQI